MFLSSFHFRALTHFHPVDSFSFLDYISLSFHTHGHLKLFDHLPAPATNLSPNIFLNWVFNAYGKSFIFPKLLFSVSSAGYLLHCFFISNFLQIIFKHFPVFLSWIESVAFSCTSAYLRNIRRLDDLWPRLFNFPAQGKSCPWLPSISDAMAGFTR